MKRFGYALFASISAAIIVTAFVLAFFPPSIPSELLHVSGTKIVDGSGNVVYLKGMQVDWNEREKVQGLTTPATNYDEVCWFALNDVQTMKAHGANVVDVASLEPYQVFPNRVPVEAYFVGRVDKIISWCTQEKMYVIIGMEHFDARWNYSISFTMMKWLWEGLYDQPTTKAEYDVIIRDFHDLSVTKQNANRQTVVDLWKWIANRYKDNPYVMYSLFNEPLCGVDLLGQAAKFAIDYSTYMTTIIDAMRSTGSRQIIFVDRPYTLSDTPTPLEYVQPIDRENIVWEDHAYVGNENLGDQNFEGWKTYVDAFAQRFMNDFGKPLYIGEWGIYPHELYHAMYPTTWQSILMNMADYLKAKGMCGQAWHNWGVLEGEYYDFESNTNYFTASESETIMQIVFN